MTVEMRYWVEEHNIDNFRADVAGEVPTEFWEQAIEEIEQIRPLFMLAESEDKDLFHKAFDMGYNLECDCEGAYGRGIRNLSRTYLYHTGNAPYLQRAGV